jgi:hypothetical protein
MARDKAKDDQLFNCNQDYELDQVASHYGVNKQVVMIFIKDACAKKVIFHSTHATVYKLIQSKFGYPVPF